MTAMDIIRARHSVRAYTDEPIEGAQLACLQRAVDEARREGGLDVQLVEDNPEVFQVVARFGLVRGAKTSVAFCAAGTESDEGIGYWGQRIVLAVQEAGLNTCWCALCSRKKSKARPGAGEKVRPVIAVGHGVDAGHGRKTKPVSELCTVEGATEEGMPGWFATAMEAAQLAPTGVNAQNFHITLREDGRTVAVRATKKSAWSGIDLGIVRCNFETAANETGADWRWE